MMPICNTSPHVNESGKFLLVKSGTLDFEIQKQLKESRIPVTIGIRDPSFTDKDWNPAPGIRNPRRGILNPRLSWIPLHEVKHEQNHIYLRYIANCCDIPEQINAPKEKSTTSFMCGYMQWSNSFKYCNKRFSASFTKAEHLLSIKNDPLLVYVYPWNGILFHELAPVTN